MNTILTIFCFILTPILVINLFLRNKKLIKNLSIILNYELYLIIVISLLFILLLLFSDLTSKILIIFNIIMLLIYFLLRKNILIIEKNENNNSSKKSFIFIIFQIVLFPIFILSYLIIAGIHWTKLTKISTIISVDSIVFTLTNSLEGAPPDMLSSAITYLAFRCVLITIIYITLSVLSYFLLKKNKFTIKLNINKKSIALSVKKCIYSISALLCTVIFSFSLIFAENTFSVVSYFIILNQKTTIYEDYYINPNDANISLDVANKKNLIYIYLESMETAYSSIQNGGANSISYIPNLEKLASENISFSNSDKLGGFYSPNRTDNTMMALFATSSGIPFSIPVFENTMNYHDEFLPKITTLGDILEEYGYNQKFICGSDARFAGRDNFFRDHGNFEIFDYHSAIKKGYIPSDYYKWWGFEDLKLYEYAKNELIELASKGEPFNFTMLTVDTHSIEGYHCELCNNFNYPIKTANIVSCADLQIYNFIEWLKTQDFYDNSIIVITGDHPRMDNILVNNNETVNRNNKPISRTIYNCILNYNTTNPINYQNRTFTSMDIFPTVLHTLGFTWDGDRLGLGTNLFSNSQTLAEEISLKTLNNEIIKKSKYYTENFL